MKRIALFAFALAALVAVAAPNFADDKKPGDKPNDEAMKKMMEECTKAATPGEHHKYLNPMAGKFTATFKYRMAPDAPWTESKSECEAEWILGGRFLVAKCKGEPMMGSPVPFEGFGMMGYDNNLKKYVSTWADNMGTMIMTAEGACDSSGKTITLTSKFNCPMMHKDTWMKSTYKIESDDKYTLTMSSPDEAGKEFTCMELNYTRKK